MSDEQDRTIQQLENRLGWERSDSMRLALGKVPGSGSELSGIDADHLILFLSDLDVSRRVLTCHEEIAQVVERMEKAVRG